MKISETVLLDWIKNKKRIQDRLNRIKKRLLKYERQKNHFSMRLAEIKKYEDANRNKHG